MQLDPIIYVIDDDDAVRQSLEFLLKTAGITVRGFESAKAFLEIMPQISSGCIITDVRMPEITGIELLQRVKAVNPDLPVIVITAYGTVESAVQALRAGAYDYITKPFESDELRLTVAQVLERQRLLVENRYLHQELEERYSFSGIVGA